MAEDANYANPDRLVTTAWVDEHKNDPGIRIIESDEDVLLYEVGHVPGAVKVDWHEDLQQQLTRDFVGRRRLQRADEPPGRHRDTTIIFYGDRNNWWAAYAYWFFRYMGHDNVKIMDGGRRKWEAEGREMTREVPSITPTSYTGSAEHPELRAFRDDVLQHIGY